MPSGSTQVRVPFDTTLPLSGLGDPATTADDLTLASIALYPGSGATTVTGLKDAIIQNVRGCQLCTGVTNACVTRPWLLGDIFHSNPLVVGEPRSFVPEASYFAFAAAHATRDKMIYAGANDGFLHAFLGGTWDATPPVGEQPAYDRGTGAETFGFMPWPVRRNIRNLPKDSGSRDFYYVDGSPVAADVWIHGSATQTAKAADGSEWNTVVAGGLRQGGSAYYAIDVTDPSAAGYPQYLWEFPKEGAAAAITGYMGETWGTPILTKVKVVISGVPYERWVAIVTGGYDKTGDPNDPVNYNATATAGRAIFMIDMKTGGILAQKKFNATASDATNQMRYAIPSTPSVLDLDGDEFADVIYVGDLGGNVWKWVVSYDPVHGNYGEDPINSSGSVDQPYWKFTNFFQTKPPGRWASRAEPITQGILPAA
jgi:type IV pilus assembly protein PilY1